MRRNDAARERAKAAARQRRREEKAMANAKPGSKLDFIKQFNNLLANGYRVKVYADSRGRAVEISFTRHDPTDFSKIQGVSWQRGRDMTDALGPRAMHNACEALVDMGLWAEAVII